MTIFELFGIKWKVIFLSNSVKDEQNLYNSVHILFVGVNTTQKCYDHLGCLEINEDWYGLTRYNLQSMRKFFEQFFSLSSIHVKCQNKNGYSYKILHSGTIWVAFHKANQKTHY